MQYFMKSRYFLLVVVCFSIILSSCEKEEPELPNEEELITSVFLRLTPEGGGDEVLFSFQDFDGDGGDAPIIRGAAVKSGLKYTGVLQFWNESVFPEQEITQEIREEGDEHQVFYESTADLSIEYLDLDVNQNPIGLLVSVTPGDPGKGQITVILKHMPKKPNDGTAVDAGGETDIEVSFGVSVEP